MTPALPIVDAHHHLWDLSRGHYPWLQEAYDPEAFFLGDYRAICRDFLATDYRTAAGPCELVATVHVEAERSRDEQLAETAWLHEVHAQHGFPNAVVAHAWFDRPDSEEQLLAQSRFPLVRGIRSKPVTSASPDHSVKGQAGTMQDEAWLRGFSLLEKYGLRWDLRVPAWHLPEAAEVAALFPKVPIALNHHGFAWDRSEEGLKRWRGWMETLARQENVHVNSRSSACAAGLGISRRTRELCMKRLQFLDGSAACSPATSRWPACVSATRTWLAVWPVC